MTYAYILTLYKTILVYGYTVYYIYIIIYNFPKSQKLVYL